MLGKCVLWVSGIVNKQIEKVDHHNGYDFFMLKEDIRKNHEYGMIFLEYDNHYFHISNNRERIKEYLDANPNFSLIEMVKNDFESQLEKGSHISKGYAEYLGRTEEAEQVAIKFKEQKEIENMKKEEERKQQELKRKNEEDERLKKVESVYVNGDKINADDFLTLCDKYYVDIPIRTRGWIINSLCDIGFNNGSTRCSYNGNKSNSIGKVAKNLYNSLTENEEFVNDDDL